jgi:hypothetical protein
MPTSIFVLMSGACFVTLFANVYKHGWQWPSVALGTFLTVLLASLAVPPGRRTGRWVVRYWVALLACCALGVSRFVL